MASSSASVAEQARVPPALPLPTPPVEKANYSNSSLSLSFICAFSFLFILFINGV